MRHPEFGKVFDEDCDGRVEGEAGEDGEVENVPEPVRDLPGGQIKQWEGVDLDCDEVEQPDDLHRGLKYSIQHLGGVDEVTEIPGLHACICVLNTKFEDEQSYGAEPPEEGAEYSDEKELQQLVLSVEHVLKVVEQNQKCRKQEKRQTNPAQIKLANEEELKNVEEACNQRSQRENSISDDCKHCPQIFRSVIFCIIED